MQKIISQLKLVYYTFFVLVFVVALSGYWLLKNGYTIDYQSQIGITLQTILYIVIIAPIPLLLSFFNRTCKKLAKIDDEQFKFSQYKKYSILKIVVIGIGLLLGVFFFYVLNRQSLLFCAAISAVVLFFCKPSITKMQIELDNLDEEQQENLGI
ncbi:MAG: hypothetical protein LBV75_07905 [Paludibacter sp.]|jgi:purine-cytosine permease-like protein|nr:hypothetical protein [Paludibacter sp.]